MVDDTEARFSCSSGCVTLLFRLCPTTTGADVEGKRKCMFCADKGENYAFYFNHRLFIGLLLGKEKTLGGGCATQSRAADSLEYSTLEDWPLVHGTAVSAIF